MPEKIKIIIEESYYKLEKEINELISQGWEFVNGCSDSTGGMGRVNSYMAFMKKHD